MYSSSWSTESANAVLKQISILVAAVFVYSNLQDDFVSIYFLGELTGVISERDYVKKVALLGKVSKETKVKDIATRKANVITASADESIESSMEKMMTKSIRHLPIMDGEKLVGIVSIKDLIKEVKADREKTIKDLSEMALGKAGATF